MDGSYYDLAFQKGQEFGASVARFSNVYEVASDMLFEALEDGNELRTTLLVGAFTVLSPDGFTDENGLSLSYSSEDDDSDWQYEADDNSFGTARWF